MSQKNETIYPKRCSPWYPFPLALTPNKSYFQSYNHIILVWTYQAIKSTLTCLSHHLTLLRVLDVCVCVPVYLCDASLGVCNTNAFLCGALCYGKRETNQNRRMCVHKSSLNSPSGRKTKIIPSQIPLMDISQESSTAKTRLTQKMVPAKRP